jgi:hypothetical protein
MNKGYFSEESVAPELNLHIYNDTLYVKHNAGFFSCTSIALFNIIRFYNNYKNLPKNVDRSSQYSFYKKDVTDLSSLYYKNNDMNIICDKYIDIVVPDDGSSPQFSDYRTVCINDIKPFIDKYFQISDYVTNIVNDFESKYNLDYKNLCSVLYRGNDKSMETKLASHEEFLEKCADIKSKNPNLKFLVQTDETEFLDKFLEIYDDSIYFQEIPRINKSNTAVHYVIDRNSLPSFGANFLAATICVSKCEHLITHSGNCGLWAVLYRGNMENVHQYLIDKWL